MELVSSITNFRKLSYFLYWLLSSLNANVKIKYVVNVIEKNSSENRNKILSLHTIYYNQVLTFIFVTYV